jgi:hypothetical protein
MKKVIRAMKAALGVRGATVCPGGGMWHWQVYHHI